MAKTVRKGQIGLEDINVGVGSFSRGTSTGGTQSITKINLNGLINTITSVSTTPYTATAGGLYLVDTTSTAITFNLPTAVGNDGMTFYIKNIGLVGNGVTVDPASSQTVDGNPTWVVSTLETLRIISDGSNWQVI